MRCPDNAAAIINSCGEFSHKGAFCNRMGGPAERAATVRKSATDRPTGHVRPERRTAAAAYQMQSKRLGNSHDRPCCSAATATQHFCGGTNYIADIKGPTRRRLPVRVNLIGWPNNAGEDRAFQYVKNKIQRSPLFCANTCKKDPGRTRRNSLATAATNFTKPGAQNKGDLCTSFICKSEVLLQQMQ